MLADHDLRVETAESAEAALEFLALHRPDVIFMDHMMPGMDGFQAVKAIKENPATATIPVMMYTSQSGELYVGQARALGAVGVLPKQIKPVEVREVLRSLHLLPGDGPAIPARRSGDLAGLQGLESVNAPADWSDLHRWLQEMLVDHNRALRADLETTVSRVLGEHLPNSGPNGAPVAPSRLPFWPAGALIATLAAVAATFVWLHLDSEAKWRAVARQNIGLLSELNARRAGDVAETTKEATRSDQPPGSAPASEPQWSPGVAAALEWSVNQGASYPADALPFDDVRLRSSRDSSTGCAHLASMAPCGLKVMWATSACGGRAKVPGKWPRMISWCRGATGRGWRRMRRGQSRPDSPWRSPITWQNLP